MKIVNGKIVPEFRPELVKASLQFMQRVQLNGQEAATFVACCDLLGAIAEGSIPVAAPGLSDSKKVVKK